MADTVSSTEKKQWDYWFEWRARARITATSEPEAREKLAQLYPDANRDGPAMGLDVTEVGALPDDLSAPIPGFEPEVPNA